MPSLIDSLKKQGVPVTAPPSGTAPTVPTPSPSNGPEQGPATSPPGPAGDPPPPKPPEKSDEEKAKEVLGLANMACVWLIKTNAKAQKIEWTPNLQAYASLSEDERTMLGIVAPSVHSYTDQFDEYIKKYPWLAPLCFGLGLAWIIRTKTETIKAHAAAALAAQGGAPPPPVPAKPTAFSLVPGKPVVLAPAPKPEETKLGATNVPETTEAPMGGLQL